MTEDQENNGNHDSIEELLMLVMQQKDQINGITELLKSAIESGALEHFLELISKINPSNIEYLTKIVSSYNMKVGIFKAIDLIPAFLSALSDEGTSDIIKAIAFNSDGISEKMVDGAKNPQKLTLLRLLALGRDPDFSAGATAMINMLSELGRTLSRVRE